MIRTDRPDRGNDMARTVDYPVVPGLAGNEIREMKFNECRIADQT